MKKAWIAGLLLLTLALTGCGAEPAQQSALPVPVVTGADTQTPEPTETSLPQALPGSSETNLSYSALYPASSTDMTSQLPYSLGEGLELTRIGSYSGANISSGKQEQVRDVFAVTVRNSGALPLTRAEFTVTTSEGTASFEVEALPAGASADICAAEGGDIGTGGSFAGAGLTSAVFADGPGPESLEYEYAEDEMQVTNTGADIEEDIVISCRVSAGGNYLGAGAIELRLEGGLASGETKAVEAPIYSGLTLEVVGARTE